MVLELVDGLHQHQLLHYNLKMINTFNGTERAQVLNSTSGRAKLFNHGIVPLKDLKVYLETNRHLPGLNKELYTGPIQAGDINNLLIQKQEEQAIYIIQLKEEKDIEIKELKARIQALESIQSQDY
jgi:hypothetical protein